MTRIAPMAHRPHAPRLAFGQLHAKTLQTYTPTPLVPPSLPETVTYMTDAEWEIRLSDMANKFNKVVAQALENKHPDENTLIEGLKKLKHWGQSLNPNHYQSFQDHSAKFSAEVTQRVMDCYQPDTTEVPDVPVVEFIPPEPGKKSKGEFPYSFANPKNGRRLNHDRAKA